MIKEISDEQCAKILAWLCCVGIRDERSTQENVFQIIQIAKDRANFHAGKEPVWRIQIKINNYIKEFERGNKEFINEVEQLFNE